MREAKNSYANFGYQVTRVLEVAPAVERRPDRRTALTLPLLPPPQKKRSPPSDSSPDTPTPGGISSLSRTSPGLRIDAPQIALVAFPGAVPEFAVDPGDPGDEAVGLDGAKNRACFGIDLMDLPIAILPHPERPFGPGEAGVRRRRAPGSSRAHGRSSDRSSGCDPRRSETDAGRRRPFLHARRHRSSAAPLRSAGSNAFSLSPDANQTC